MLIKMPLYISTFKKIKRDHRAVLGAAVANCLAWQDIDGDHFCKAYL